MLVPLTMRQDQETTSPIKREELLGLLNTMSTHENQRVTAEITAPTPLIDDKAAETTMSGEFHIRFKAMLADEPEQTEDHPATHLLVTAAAFLVTMVVGTFAILLS